MLTTTRRSACDYICRKLKGTAGLIGQFSSDDSQMSVVRFNQSFLPRLNSHLFVIKSSVISHSVVVNFVTGCALVNNEMHALVYAQDTECY